MATAGAERGDPAPERVPRVRRLEPPAIGAVLWRELTVFRRYWRSTTFSSVIHPTIFLCWWPCSSA